MKRIPRAFTRDPETQLLLPEPCIPWFAQGLGIAYRKWDGVPILIQQDADSSAFIVYRGARTQRSTVKDLPKGFIESSDAGTPELSGWLPAQRADLQVMAAVTVATESNLMLAPGTYEMCGPGVKGNPEGFDLITLVDHKKIAFIRCPRTLKDLIWFLSQHECEGIVWEYDGQFCQVTRSDVGLPWPVTEVHSVE